MMNRRQLNQTALLGLSGLSTGLVHAQAVAASPAKTSGTIAVAAGKDFAVLKPTAPHEAPEGKIEVVEFFWYNCPHCHSFEPILAEWVKTLAADVVFRKVPVAFNVNFLPQQKMFYTLEAMGLLGKLHSSIFEAVHKKHQRLDTEAQIKTWMGKQGVDMSKFNALYGSFAINSKAARATKLQDAYRVDGVPALGVHGQFFTSPQIARGMERSLQVVNTLVGQLRRK